MAESDHIAQVRYKPPASYGLDLEIFSVSELRRRASADYLRTPERIEFYLLIVVTEGQCSHTVDFETITCRPGSFLFLRPGQVQCFDATTDWQGWLVIFLPEFLQPREAAPLISDLDIFRQLQILPAHCVLNGNERQTMEESIARMFRDTQLQVHASIQHMLLRSQLHALLIRLQLAQERFEQAKHIISAHLQRFKRYRLTLEQEFHRWHRVSDYASHIGCSEKSISRATHEMAGVSAKKFLSQRIILEAKRLLAHTPLSVSAIAEELGFDEATNFIKFFRRETGRAPGDFRRQHADR